MHKTSANNHIHAEQENTYAANRTHKDTVFRDLFGTEENKANTLSLYNALSGKDYTDPNLLELTTIDSVLYMSVKNDISFLINDELRHRLRQGPQRRCGQGAPVHLGKDS